MEFPLDLFTKKLPGQLPRPEPLKDLFGDYAAYQGQQDGSIDGCINIYVKRPNSTKLEIIYDVPREALQKLTPANKYCNASGTWLLMAGPKGVPTYAEQVLGVMQTVFQHLADEKKRADIIESTNRALRLQSAKDEGEKIEDIAEKHKKISEATRIPYLPKPDRSPTKLT